MKVYRTKTWQHEVTGFDGNTILFGVNIFDYEWKSTGEEMLDVSKKRFAEVKICLY